MTVCQIRSPRWTSSKEPRPWSIAGNVLHEYIYMYPEFRLCPMNDTRDRKKKENSKSHFYYNPGQNVWNTLCFRWGKCISCWSPFPLEQCWVLQAKHLLQDLNFVRGGGGGGLGENLVKAVFMSVYCRLAAIPYKNTWKRGGVPKPFGQDCRLNSVLTGEQISPSTV